MNFWLDFIVSTLAAVLQGLGIGSSGTLVIYLTMWAGWEQVTAQRVNLIFFIFSAVAALFFHIRKRKIYWGVLLCLTLFGVLGAVAGSLLLNVFDPDLVRKIFGGMLVISGLLGLFGRSGKKVNATLTTSESRDTM